MSAVAMRPERVGPLVRELEPGLLEMTAEAVTDEQLSEHFELFGAYCDRNTEPCAMLVEAGPFLKLSPLQRRRLAEFEERLHEHDRTYVAGCALHAPNTLVRGLMTAVFWLKPPVYDYRFVSSREEGLRWLRERLDAMISRSR